MSMQEEFEPDNLGPNLDGWEVDLNPMDATL